MTYTLLEPRRRGRRCQKLLNLKSFKALPGQRGAPQHQQVKFIRGAYLALGNVPVKQKAERVEQQSSGSPGGGGGGGGPKTKRSAAEVYVSVVVLTGDLSRRAQQRSGLFYKAGMFGIKD